MTSGPTLHQTTGQSAERYHGLDGLRGFAMLMGIVLHATLPYFSRIAEIEFFWPADDDQSVLMFVVFDFIHAWRMPTFFLLAGFFAHLVLVRRPTTTFLIDRLKRIALPLALFGPVMAVIIPAIWIYGWFGTVTLEAFQEVLGARPDLDSSGDVVAHLWFLYYLLLMYGALICARLLGGFLRSKVGVGQTGRVPIGRYLGKAVYTRVPLLLVLAAVVLLVVRAANESKPIWPLNWPDLLYATLFFLYGYGLYARRELVGRLRRTRILVALWALAILAFCVNIVLVAARAEATGQRADVQTIEVLWLIGTVFYGGAAVFFSLGLVGLFERLLRSSRGWVRWLADSSYWVYIVHLPVVTFLTFFLAHLDRQGRLEAMTGFGWSAEIKFLAACFVTTALGLVTYRYLVRYTPLGTLLNGRRAAT